MSIAEPGTRALHVAPDICGQPALWFLKCILIACFCSGGRWHCCIKCLASFHWEPWPHIPYTPLSLPAGAKCWAPSALPPPTLLSYITTFPTVGEQPDAVDGCGPALCPQDALPLPLSSLSLGT